MPGNSAGDNSKKGKTLPRGLGRQRVRRMHTLGIGEKLDDLNTGTRGLVLQGANDGEAHKRKGGEKVIGTDQGGYSDKQEGDKRSMGCSTGRSREGGGETDAAPDDRVDTKGNVKDETI